MTPPEADAQAVTIETLLQSIFFIFLIEIILFDSEAIFQIRPNKLLQEHVFL